MAASDTLAKLVRAFPAQTKALLPGDALYVSGLHLEGETDKRDPVVRFASYLAASEAPLVTLFSGLIGTGKSTELLRLQDILLRKHNERAFVLNMADFVNLNSPIQITDLLVSMVAALSELVHKETDKNPITQGSKLEDFFSFVLAKVEIKELEVNTGIGVKFKGMLKRDPSLKLRVQDLLSTQLDPLFEKTLEAFKELGKALRNRFDDESSFVILLDSLEQLQDADVRGREVKQSLVHLVSHYLDQLYIPGFKVVYSVPPYLLNLVPQLAQRLGEICRLTNVHVFKERSRGLDTEGGVNQLTAVLRKRVEACGALDQIFTGPATTLLIKNSGGDLRTLFTLARQTALYQLAAELPRLPLDEADVIAAARQIRNSQGLLTDEALARLVHISREYKPETGAEGSLTALAQDLDTKRVMLYRNGTDWYGVNPLLWDEVDACAQASAEKNPS